MRKFSRFFVFLLSTGLFTAYAPMTLAEMQQQGYGVRHMHLLLKGRISNTGALATAMAARSATRR